LAGVSEAVLARIAADVEEEIDAAVASARAAEAPDFAHARADVYAR